MITKLASAAVVTFALAGGALTGTAMAGSADLQTTTLHFDAGAASTAAGRAAMLVGIQRSARATCTDTGTRLRDRSCEAAFTTSAIASIERPDLRAQLKQDTLGAAAPGVAVAAAPGG